MFSKRSLRTILRLNQVPKQETLVATGLAAMLAAKKSGGVAVNSDPEDTNERINPGFKSKGRRHQKVQECGHLGGTKCSV